MILKVAWRDLEDALEGGGGRFLIWKSRVCGIWFLYYDERRFL
jgi:hypothetical protein